MPIIFHFFRSNETNPQSILAAFQQQQQQQQVPGSTSLIGVLSSATGPITFGREPSLPQQHQLDHRYASKEHFRVVVLNENGTNNNTRVQLEFEQLGKNPTFVDGKALKAAGTKYSTPIISVEQNFPTSDSGAIVASRVFFPKEIGITGIVFVAQNVADEQLYNTLSACVAATPSLKLMQQTNLNVDSADNKSSEPQPSFSSQQHPPQRGKDVPPSVSPVVQLPVRRERIDEKDSNSVLQQQQPQVERSRAVSRVENQPAPPPRQQSTEGNVNPTNSAGAGSQRDDDDDIAWDLILSQNKKPAPPKQIRPADLVPSPKMIATPTNTNPPPPPPPPPLQPPTSTATSTTTKTAADKSLNRPIPNDASSSSSDDEDMTPPERRLHQPRHQQQQQPQQQSPTKITNANNNNNTSSSSTSSIQRPQQHQQQAIRWQWKMHTNAPDSVDSAWKDYNSKQNEELEKAFASKKDMYDLDGTYAVAFCDKDVGMVQYRLDDTTRWRSVRRVGPRNVDRSNVPQRHIIYPEASNEGDDEDDSDEYAEGWDDKLIRPKKGKNKKQKKPNADITGDSDDSRDDGDGDDSFVVSDNDDDDSDETYTDSEQGDDDLLSSSSSSDARGDSGSSSSSDNDALRRRRRHTKKRKHHHHHHKKATTRKEEKKHKKDEDKKGVEHRRDHRHHHHHHQEKKMPQEASTNNAISANNVAAPSKNKANTSNPTSFDQFDLQ